MAPFRSFSQRSTSNSSSTSSTSSSSSSSSPASTSPNANLLFPTFLLPSLPFRRRRPATTTTTPTKAPTPQKQAGHGRAESGTGYLKGAASTLHCARCAADLCHTSQIISKGFTGRHGRAYLVSPFCSGGGPSSPPSTSASASASASAALPNTHLHAPTPRHLVTGLHTVSDMSCVFCGSLVGWKYVAAEEEGQRYKVGKFILETRRVVPRVGWEGPVHPEHSVEDEGEDGGGERGERGEWVDEADGEVEFDSEDEEECEELFAGVWTVEGARERRRGRVSVGGR